MPIYLDNLNNLLEENRIFEVKDLLAKLVTFYQSNSKIVDLIYEEQSNFNNELKSSKGVKSEENNVVGFKNK